MEEEVLKRSPDLAERANKVSPQNDAQRAVDTQRYAVIYLDWRLFGAAGIGCGSGDFTAGAA